MTKRFGFTLAEVLITLGIIGVVAAMTIPTLISNTNGAKYRSQFKKSISTLNQAGLMAQAQYDFDYAGTVEACPTDQTQGAAQRPDEKMTFCAILNGTLTGQTFQGTADKIQRASTNADGTTKSNNYAWVKKNVLTQPSDYLAYTLADGSIIGFKKGALGCELPVGTQMTGNWITNHDICTGFIDVNGSTLPNKEVSCSDGKDTDETVETPCVVKNNANDMTDVFPIVFHDATVEPATNAAKYVLTSAK